MKDKFGILRLLLPIILALFVFGFDTSSSGTDLAAQIFSLKSIQDLDFKDLLDSQDEKSFLFSLIYLGLYKVTFIEPIQFISIFTFANFFLYYKILKKYICIAGLKHINSTDSKFVLLLAVMSFCPIFICIARFFLATVFIMFAIDSFLSKKYIFIVLYSVLAYYTHEGVVLIICILLLSCFVRFLLLSKTISYYKRNMLVSLICLMFLFVGPVLFSNVASLFANASLLNDRYIEMYANGSAGDGAYKFVLVLTMLGVLQIIYFNVLFDRKNDWLTSIMISSLLVISILFNQKIFLVQRVLMFMPVFIGLSSLRILNDRHYHVSIVKFYTLSLYAVIFMYFFQLFLNYSIFFANLW